MQHTMMSYNWYSNSKTCVCICIAKHDLQECLDAILCSSEATEGSLFNFLINS